MVSPEITELRQKYELLNERVARVEGRTSGIAKQMICQLAIFVIVMGGLVIGLVNHQARVLDKRINEIKLHKDLGDRLERVERNLDELNKELRSRSK